MSFTNSAPITVGTSFATTGPIELTVNLLEFTGGFIGTLYAFINTISSATTLDYKITIDVDGNAAVVPTPSTPQTIELGQDTSKGSLIVAVNTLTPRMFSKFESVNRELKIYLWLATDAGTVVVDNVYLTLETYSRI
jgi:hypothetical protein